MFLPNKIIKNKKLNYPQKNDGIAHGFGFIVHGLIKPCAKHSKQPMVLLYMVQEALHMVFKPCAKPPKQPMVLLYMVQEDLANGFKTMCKAS